MRLSSRSSALLRSSAALVCAVGLLTGCASVTDSGKQTDTFQWYADGCVQAAETAQGLYSGADSPIGRQIAEKGIDALVAAARQVAASLPPDSEVTARLNGVLETIEARTPLTDISENDTARFEKNKAVILEAIGEVGQMCRSVFAGFDVTRSPAPQ